MKIRKGRTNSRGLVGTYANAKHHARKLIPMIKAIEGVRHTFGFKEWVEFNNQHHLITYSGQTYELVPIVRDNESYIGIQLRLRISRKVRIALFDCTDINDVPAFINFMQMLSNRTDDTVRVGGGIRN